MKLSRYIVVKVVCGVGKCSKEQNLPITGIEGIGDLICDERLYMLELGVILGRYLDRKSVV